MSTKLIVSDGKRERALVLVDKLIVGSDPSCDVSHEDDLLSRRHAEFVVGADTVTVRDLGSRNGIFVNGLRTAERALHPGDVVQIGPLRVLYAHDLSSDTILPEQALADRTMVAPPQSAPPAAPVPRAVHTDEERTQVLGAPAARDAAREAVAPPAAPSAPSGTSATRITPAPATPRPWQPPATPAAAPTPAPTPPAAAIVAPPAAPPVTPPPVTPPPVTPLQVAAPPAAAPGFGALPRSATATPAPPARAESLMEPTRLAPPPAIAGRSVESELTGYVFGQAATLGIVVLLSALVPLWLVRSDAMGVWLVVPIVMTIATTYLVAGFINRRFARIVRALQPETMSGESFRGSRGSPSGLFRS